MSSAFSWNKVLGEGETAVNPAVAEGLAIDPVSGQPILSAPAPAGNPFLTVTVNENPSVESMADASSVTLVESTSVPISPFFPAPEVCKPGLVEPLVTPISSPFGLSSVDEKTASPLEIPSSAVGLKAVPEMIAPEPIRSVNPFLAASSPTPSISEPPPVASFGAVPLAAPATAQPPIIAPPQEVLQVTALPQVSVSVPPPIASAPTVPASSALAVNVTVPAENAPQVSLPTPSQPPVLRSTASVPSLPVVEDVKEKIPPIATSNQTQYKPAPLPQSVFSKPVEESKYTLDAPPARAKRGESDVKSLTDVHIDDILRAAIERKASDIHLTVGLPPMMRMDGDVVPLPFEVLGPQDTRRLVYDVLTNDHMQKFETRHELDFAHSVTGLARFRFNVYMQRGSVACALRVIPTKIPSFDSLGLPPVIREMSKRTSGLILVTGPTGSGKSTTIASMVDDINETRQNHILTIEDPIEYLHAHKKCMVNQRELHADTFSFKDALRAVLREDPDIILVGELRDLETIEAALTLAETGHLVFGTLHTRNAPSTIDRIVDVFPSDQQDQIRVLLGNTLEGVVSQQLLPKLGGGRCAAIEIMLGTPAIKNLIREGKTHQMYSSIETSSQIGMQTMDRSLADHFRNGHVSYEECLMRAVDKETFSRLAKGG